MFFTLIPYNIRTLLVSRNMEKSTNRRNVNFSAVLKRNSVINMKNKKEENVFAFLLLASNDYF